ncbi:GNAT family N-acetyltransferase [Gorillibacterium sp. sgz500922]|uniref:GNAT family N-acetyltransferase n=1 Tax=Gorillibacterium sp. sgz500922 TaxID=3446694 RepID=UPI003F67EE18
MELETERLVLREYASNDYKAVHRYTSDAETTKHMLWGPNTEADTRAFLASAAETAGADPRTGFELAVIRREDGRLAGGVCLYRDGFRGELGYCFAPEHRNAGYATEASRELMRFAFEELGLHRLYATCRPENAASARVLEKLGLQREGHLREHRFAKGRYHDSLLYSMLDREWSGSR